MGLIRLASLTKRYGAVTALEDLTVELEPGIIGLVGSNGAGKSTLIRILLGLLAPTAGQAFVMDRDVTREGTAVRALVGYMPESDCLSPGMTAVELVTTLGRITGLSEADAMTRAHEALDYVGLDEQRYRDMNEYSTGMKQRVKLAQALAHDPPLLLLDEPTNGLDPKGRRHMLELIADLGHAQEKNIILCSHLLPDVERTCDHVVVLDRGRAVKSGSIAELTRADGRSVRVRSGGDAGAFTAELAASGLAFEREEDGALLVAARGADADELFAAAARARVRIEAVEELRASLDQVFLQVLREAQGAAR